MRMSLLLAGLVAAVPAIAGPVEITSNVLAEKRAAAADGTTRVSLAPATRVIPGDRVVFQLEYRNNGKQAASGLVIANPVPAAMQYVSPAEGSPAPELSVDGTTTVVVGAVLSMLSVIGAPAVSTLPALSLLQKAISCVPSVP